MTKLICSLLFVTLNHLENTINFIIIRFLYTKKIDIFKFFCDRVEIVLKN